jgi:hypothetical protein
MQAACSPSSARLTPVLTTLAGRLLETFLGNPPLALTTPITPHTTEEGEIMRNELCLQAHTEARWENLVTSMAPSCTAFSQIHDPIAALLDATQTALGATGPCPEPTISIPPTLETSVAGIGYGRLPSGQSPFTLAQYRALGRVLGNQITRD